MRPLRLEAEGFTVFRQPVTVDFADADLFALVGPTGAGKTSLIDAITFALYGSVPRLDDRRAVAPVVSQNLTEARVRLDFAVGDTTYTAVRVVRITKTGATTKEARLQRGDEVIAGTVDEVGAEVVNLLGLTYEHFTTCVSLPQGQFARFLHDKPRDRQDLLVRLLDLGLYDKVASAARQRAVLAANRVEVLGGQLERLAAATPQAQAEAEQRVAALAGLADTMTAARPELDRLVERAQAARGEAGKRREHLARLQALRAPDGVAELSERLAEVVRQREVCVEAEAIAAGLLVEAEADVDKLPARSRLEAVGRDLVQRSELEVSVEKGEQAAVGAASAVEEQQELERKAADERERCAAELERLRVEHRAHALVPALREGEPCPVCRQTVTTIPSVEAPGVADAERALAEADRQAKQVEKALRDASNHQIRVDEKLARVRHDLDQVRTRLAEATVPSSRSRSDTSSGSAITAGSRADGSGVSQEAEPATGSDPGSAVDTGGGTDGSTLAVDQEVAGSAASPPAEGVGMASGSDRVPGTVDETSDGSTVGLGLEAVASPAAASAEGAGTAPGAGRNPQSHGCTDTGDAADGGQLDFGSIIEPAPSGAVTADEVDADHLVADEVSAAQVDPQWVEVLLDEVGQAEQAVVKARQADRAARQALNAADRQREQLLADEAGARRAFDTARDSVAVLDPPAAERADLASDWQGLLDWAAERRPALTDEADEHDRAAATAESEAGQRRAELAEACRSAGVEPPRLPAWPGEAVAAAHARAEETVGRIVGELAEAERLRTEVRVATETRQVAEALASHLAANRFEKWLLDEAVHRLVAGASDILGELTGNAYALSVDRRSGAFTVVDHTNASQARSARTLSGGETFLASLALALALADQVAELAAGGTARLESLFLDEGFGTLDPDTLDVVATALDELGARGRMVGVVTHVRELAERLPVRFEVRKAAGTATVDRIDA